MIPVNKIRQVDFIYTEGKMKTLLDLGVSCSLSIFNDFHGEYDIDWIIVSQNGKEIERHAINQYTTIYWQ
jgi:hypothetical protein